ncbi:MAG: YjhX family toxin [Devosia sp.]|uniref:YjhX family toxin n=1 Tax=Devosia sp. TaxID=1871048 RepID=UPI0024C982EF|nr:YjhX family toxin [Devosia sp.]UYO00380.1 MAG: YjhX family toxin [Devosia sp.]
MDISRNEQRVLHALAQGGRIAAIKDERGKIAAFEFFSRDGWLINGLTPLIFSKLKAKKAIKSQGGGPYRITKRGLELVRSQVDNR